MVWAWLRRLLLTLQPLMHPKVFELAWFGVLLTLTLVLQLDELKPWLCPRHNRRWQRLAFTVPIVCVARAGSLLADLANFVVWLGKIVAACKEDKEDELRNVRAVLDVADGGSYLLLARVVLLDVLITLLVVFSFKHTLAEHCAGVTI